MNYNGSSLYGNYRTRTFGDVFETSAKFIEELNKTPFAKQLEGEKIDYELVHALLYARYGNSNVASSDENRFKWALFSILYQYGPTWQKRLEIQKDLRRLSLEDAMQGAESIYNHAANPSMEPTTQTNVELPYVNDQNVSKYKKAPVDAAMNLWDMLRVDVSEIFIKQFQKLFIIYVEPELPLWYQTQEA